MIITDKEDIKRKRQKTLPSYPPGPGFGSMDPSNNVFGNRDDSSNGSSGSNGQFMNGPQGNGSMYDCLWFCCFTSTVNI